MKFEEITLFGSTGLIGGLLLKLLVNDSDFKKIKVVSRKSLSLNHEKITNKIIDFSNYKSLSKSVKNSKIVFDGERTENSNCSVFLKINKKIDFCRRYLHNSTKKQKINVNSSFKIFYILYIHLKISFVD